MAYLKWVKIFSPMPVFLPPPYAAVDDAVSFIMHPVDKVEKRDNKKSYPRYPRFY